MHDEEEPERTADPADQAETDAAPQEPPKPVAENTAIVDEQVTPGLRENQKQPAQVSAATHPAEAGSASSRSARKSGSAKQNPVNGAPHEARSDESVAERVARMQTKAAKKIAKREVKSRERTTNKDLWGRIAVGALAPAATVLGFLLARDAKPDPQSSGALVAGSNAPASTTISPSKSAQQATPDPTPPPSSVSIPPVTSTGAPLPASSPVTSASPDTIAVNTPKPQQPASRPPRPVAPKPESTLTTAGASQRPNSDPNATAPAAEAAEDPSPAAPRLKQFTLQNSRLDAKVSFHCRGEDSPAARVHFSVLSPETEQRSGSLPNSANKECWCRTERSPGTVCKGTCLPHEERCKFSLSRTSEASTTAATDASDIPNNSER